MMARLHFCSMCVLSGVMWLLCVCVLLLRLEGGQRGVCGLFAMWYFILMLENRRLCLGRICDSVPEVGYELVYCSLLFRKDMLLS